MKKSFIQFITIVPLVLLICLTFSCQKQAEEAAEEAKLVVVKASPDYKNT